MKALIILIIFIVGYTLLIFRKKEKKEYSRIILITIIISILANLALLENYLSNLTNQNLNEGICISNNIAYLIIGEDRWSINSFHDYFNNSLIISGILLIAYIVLIYIEQKSYKKKIIL